MRRVTGWIATVAVAAIAVPTLAVPTLAVPTLAKDSDDPIVAGNFGKQVEEAVDAAAGSDFWGTVLVARQGEIVLAKGYGNADFESRPNTPRTLFELASVSKHVTAAAVLHLSQGKKLSLDDPLTRFFKGVPEDKQAISVHQLLTHTSGLTLEGVGYSSPISRKDYVELILGRPLASPPGETYAYSNVGYAMLAAIIEEATKKPFEAYCEKHLFKPAKMSDTGFIGDKDLVKSKRVSKRRGKLPGTASEWSWGWGYRGMGGVVTTILDLHRWDRALRSDDLLDKATRAAYYEPFKDGYACGWKVAVTDRGTKQVSHTGSVSGYRTNFVRYLEDDACIAVLGNDGEKMMAISQAVDALLFEAPELTADLRPKRLGSQRVAVLQPDVRWDVRKKGKRVTVALVEGKDRVAEIRGTSGFALGLAHRLETVANAAAGEPDAEPSVRGRIDLSAYSGKSKIELTKGLTIEIKPYPSNPARPLVFLLQDAAKGRAAIVIEMNAAAATALVAALRE